tara:strand:- start:310 stop:1362 length:1053 start_codon:yes stop_codon:yes gene_type:complete
MNIDFVKNVELEITSDCNAACPGCARTLNLDILKVQSFSLADLRRLFPTKRYIQDKHFKFCGVLGDPLIHTEFLDMVKYLLSNNPKRISVSTNTGLGTVDTWTSLGKLAYKHEEKVLAFDFCIDGHEKTNHIYRVNTKWNTIMRNLEAFTKEAKEKSIGSSWTYIVFDHNEHEVETAIADAKRLGLRFNTRTGMRNSYHEWIAEIGRKNNKVKKIITTTGKKEHKEKEKVLQLDKMIKNKTLDESILQTIKCKFYHQGEIFIGSDLSMWPCCFLYDSAFKNQEKINNKLSKYVTDWNSLKTKTIDDVLQHPWYTEVLSQSWNPKHDLHLARCVRTCGYNQAYHNKKEEVA